jgi:pimeloyl-ACP methyl ester carboxylesterase
MKPLTITRSAGRGPCHTLLVPGLVPDGPETFLRQSSLFRSLGSTATFTYPYDHFDLDEAITAVRRELATAHAARRITVLVGVSVGGGLAIELLRRLHEEKAPVPLCALILISPLSCTGDMSSLLAKLFRGIEAEEARGANGDMSAALERGRAFFKSLASRSAGSKAPDLGRLRSLFTLLTPRGLMELRDRRIRDRIERTLDDIPAQGALARVLALRELHGLGKVKHVLATVPTLILWGSKERHTLDMDGPGTSRLCRPDLATRLFPDCEVHWIYGHDGEEVPHASLLKHAGPFNRPMRSFVKRVVKGEMAKRPLLQRTPFAQLRSVMTP